MNFWKNELKKISRETITLINSLEIPDNPCIIFSLDNTIIHESGEIINSVADIYKHAFENKIKIFIITERDGSDQKVIDDTLNELKKYNLKFHESIYFKKYKLRDNEFKINSRKNITERGYNIILCISTDDNDLYGEYTGIPVKIPIIKNLDIIPEE